MARNLAEFDPVEQRRRLKVLRAKHDLSGPKLATALGLDRSTVAGYETGRKVPDKIAQKLHDLYPEDWPAPVAAPTPEAP